HPSAAGRGLQPDLLPEAGSRLPGGRNPGTLYLSRCQRKRHKRHIHSTGLRRFRARVHRRSDGALPLLLHARSDRPLIDINEMIGDGTCPPPIISSSLWFSGTTQLKAQFKPFFSKLATACTVPCAR